MDYLQYFNAMTSYEFIGFHVLNLIINGLPSIPLPKG